MDAIIKFFTGIGDAISAAFDWFLSFLSDCVYLVSLTGRFLVQIPILFSWLPSELLSILVLIFTIVVLYKILGREG